MGLAKRIIPCLDIAAGRVVKGVNFVNLRDAGDPVEVARRYDAEGADELAFLDIRASIETRGLLYDMIEAVADVGVHSADGGRRRQLDRRHPRAAQRRRRQGQHQHRGRGQSGAVRRGRRALRRAVHRRGDRREAVGARAVARLHARRPHADRARCRRLGARGRRSRRRRDPADQHGSRRRALRLRSRADARRGRRGRCPGHRVGRRGIAAPTWSTASSRAAPTRCSPHRSSITASSRSARRRPRWRRPASKCAECARRSRDRTSAIVLDTPRNGRTLGSSLATNPHLRHGLARTSEMGGRRPRRGRSRRTPRPARC